MWKNWVNGILGLWVLLIPFLSFSLSIEKTVLIITGIIIAVLGFWSVSENGARGDEEPAIAPTSTPPASEENSPKSPFQSPPTSSV